MRRLLCEHTQVFDAIAGNDNSVDIVEIERWLHGHANATKGHMRFGKRAELVRAKSNGSGLLAVTPTTSASEAPTQMQQTPSPLTRSRTSAPGELAGRALLTRSRTSAAPLIHECADRQQMASPTKHPPASSQPLDASADASAPRFATSPRTASCSTSTSAGRAAAGGASGTLTAGAAVNIVLRRREPVQEAPTEPLEVQIRRQKARRARREERERRELLRKYEGSARVARAKALHGTPAKLPPLSASSSPPIARRVGGKWMSPSAPGASSKLTAQQQAAVELRGEMRYQTRLPSFEALLEQPPRTPLSLCLKKHASAPTLPLLRRHEKTYERIGGLKLNLPSRATVGVTD